MTKIHRFLDKFFKLIQQRSQNGQIFKIFQCTQRVNWAKYTPQL